MAQRGLSCLASGSKLPEKLNSSVIHRNDGKSCVLCRTRCTLHWPVWIQAVLNPPTGIHQELEVLLERGWDFQIYAWPHVHAHMCTHMCMYMHEHKHTHILGWPTVSVPRTVPDFALKAYAQENSQTWPNQEGHLGTPIRLSNKSYFIKKRLSTAETLQEKCHANDVLLMGRVTQSPRWGSARSQKHREQTPTACRPFAA